MSESRRDGRSLVCWNCDRQAHAAIGVALRAPSGEQAAMTLCQDCYVSAYLPLAAETEGLTTEGGPSKATAWQ